MRQGSSKKTKRKAMSAEERRLAHCKAQSKYRTSERGLFMQREWRRTPKGYNCNWEYERSSLGRWRALMYEMSDKGRATRAAYIQSDKGRATRAAYIQSGRSRQMAYARYHSPRGEELRWAKHNKRLAELTKYLISPAGRTDWYAAEQYRRLVNFMDTKIHNLPPSEKTLKARARRERKRQEAIEWQRAQIKRAQDDLKPQRRHEKGFITWDEAVKAECETMGIR
jgi:hypothetical protein